jgi:hypothetical protein
VPFIYKPAQAEKGRIPDKRERELTRIWEVVDQAEPSVIDLLHRVVDIASAIIGESRVHREESVGPSPEADQLPMTLAATGEEGPTRQGGTEADSHPVEDIGAVAAAFAFQRSAEQQRDAAWARLEALAGQLREARAGIASLNAGLRAAEEIKA